MTCVRTLSVMATPLLELAGSRGVCFLLRARRLPPPPCPEVSRHPPYGASAVLSRRGPGAPVVRRARTCYGGLTSRRGTASPCGSGASLSALGRWRCRTRGVGAARGRRAGTPATNDGSRPPRGALADCPDAVKIARESRRTVPWKIWGGERQTTQSPTASIHPCRRAPGSCRVPRSTTVNPAAVITPASSSTGQYHAVVTA